MLTNLSNDLGLHRRLFGITAILFFGLHRLEDDYTDFNTIAGLDNDLAGF